jgi:putative membrane protein
VIEYDKRRWTSHLFDIEGSMVREITGRVAAAVVWSAVVVAAHHTAFELRVSPTTHTLVGLVLGLLLVFRTNASYDRYWEGRRLWGSIINESRNLARGARAYITPAAPDLAWRIGLWVQAFCHVSMNSLRSRSASGDGVDLGPAGALLPAGEVAAVLGSAHAPLAAASRVSETLAEARGRGVISDIVLTMLDANTQQLIDYIGGCERIYKTPLPFVYVVHLRRALILYCFTLPLTVVQFYGWWTVLVTLLASYAFFGIEEIGVEIENPFGNDPNDLPLESFCSTIERDVLSLLPAPTSDGIANVPTPVLSGSERV